MDELEIRPSEFCQYLRAKRPPKVFHGHWTALVLTKCLSATLFDITPINFPSARWKIQSDWGSNLLRAQSKAMALNTFYRNKIEGMKLEILQGQAVLRRLEAQRNDYNSRVRLLREELGLLQQPGSYVGEVVKVMGTKKVLVKVHPEGKYGQPSLPPKAPTT